MIDKNSIPNCKHDATLDLKGRKQALLDINQQILDHDLNTVEQISGVLWSYIDEIDTQLEGPE